MHADAPLTSATELSLVWGVRARAAGARGTPCSSTQAAASRALPRLQDNHLEPRGMLRTSWNVTKDHAVASLVYTADARASAHACSVTLTVARGSSALERSKTSHEA